MVVGLPAPLPGRPRVVNRCSVKPCPRVGARRAGRLKTFRHAFPDSSSKALLASPYDVLGVPSDATPEEIKLAFRKRCKALHPDVNPSPNAAEAFRRVNKAYGVISDVDRRLRFDRGNDLDAMDDGFAPDMDTKRRANVDRYRNSSSNGYEDQYWDGVAYAKGKPPGAGRGDSSASSINPSAIAKNDFELKKQGERKIIIERLQRLWTAWCTAWFVALTVGVPFGVGYWVVYGVAAETLGGLNLPIGR